MCEGRGRRWRRRQEPSPFSPYDEEDLHSSSLSFPPKEHEGFLSTKENQNKLFPLEIHRSLPFSYRQRRSIYIVSRKKRHIRKSSHTLLKATITFSFLTKTRTSVTEICSEALLYYPDGGVTKETQAFLLPLKTSQDKNEGL